MYVTARPGKFTESGLEVTRAGQLVSNGDRVSVWLCDARSLNHILEMVKIANFMLYLSYHN